MRLAQGISGNLSTVAVTIGNITVVLQGVSIDRLRAGGFSFADGSMAIVGDGLATSSADGSANTINGGTGNDYLSGLAGNDSIVAGGGSDRILTGSGTDTVVAGEGQDTIEAEGTLAAASRFDGGTGYDELRLDGNYAAASPSSMARSRISSASCLPATIMPRRSAPTNSPPTTRPSPTERRSMWTVPASNGATISFSTARPNLPASSSCSAARARIRSKAAPDPT
jgi:hypothetical protein